ncbi:unnamed protein product [Anisakis simplex]|uniref:Uncharacterized protein n=1 Tax=Anisakis simplex TaxID=6269 RepID=A0A3P6S3Q9_ANISI|nr:unnamed protein product [Anisakis simplex]
MDYQPAAYFCVYQKVRQRAVSQHIDSFDDRPYANLPGPAMARGVNLDVWMRRYFNPKPPNVVRFNQGNDPMGHKTASNHLVRNGCFLCRTSRPRQWNYDYARRVYNEKLHVAIKNIGLMESGIDCNKLTRENGSALYRERTKRWKYNFNISNPLLKLRNRTGRCNYLTNQYGFNTLPLSDEEKEFPIAYGLLIFKNAIQIYHMMSAIYHPQNAYCIAISNGSDAEFKRSVNFIGECFPNVHVMIVSNVRWGGHGVLTGVLDCLRYLAASKIEWKYFQYLSGTDLPLKTNREMVRIFKRLNGTFNSEVTEFQEGRLGPKKGVIPPHGIRLFKSSLSATFSRESANFIANSATVNELVDYLNGTDISDEGFWTTVAGNPEKIPMPGAFNGTRFLQFVNEIRRKQREENRTESTMMHYYISRYQVWTSKPNKFCTGTIVASSCVYGVGDIPILLRRYELVAHKFYLDYQPAAYFCVYQKIYHMMSAIYHPQNAYCIAISNGSDAEFKRSVNFIGECFPNVHVMIVRDVRWGEYGVLTGVLDCLRFLAASKIKWKYYQYLSGFDLPLKTNGEMVRIFKRLNGSFNSEVTHFENYRIAKKKSAKPPQGVRLFKSSLSATFSRESANFMVNNKKVKELIDYLNGTFIPDETFWTTVAGNPEKYPMPGGFNGTRFLRFVEELERRQQKEYSMKYTTDSSQYYISRYQVWWGVLNMICAGKFVAGSCVYGVGDIPILLRRYELVAHKFYLDYQPAAYFCVYQKVRQRAVSQHIDSFDDRPYANLPGPAMARGVNLDVWMRRYFNPKPVTRAP